MKMRFVVLFILLVFAATAQATVVRTTAYGIGADTYLTNDDRDGPDVAHGTEEGMEIRDLAGVRQRIVYMRFDLTGVEGDMSGAYLTLNFTYSKRSRTLGVYGLTWQDTAAESWDEATTTYNNCAAMVAAPSGYYALNQALYPRQGDFAVTTTLGQQSTNPTDLDLTSFLNADNNDKVTFAVIWEFGSDSNPDWWITTKEGAAAGGDMTLAPTLTLPNAIPEPATIALLGLGGLALLRRKR